MPFLKPTNELPEMGAKFTLNHGTWGEDEAIWLKPCYDVFAQKTAAEAANIEVDDGWEAPRKGLPKRKKTKRVFVPELYYKHLILNHIVKSTLKEPDGKLAEPSVNYLIMLGPENGQELLDAIFSLAGLPPGGFVTVGPDGKEVSFRSPGGTDPEKPADDVRAPEHDNPVERSADLPDDGVGLLDADAATDGLARARAAGLVA